MYNGEYLYPPRPTNATVPGMMSFYENRKWWAQVKKNGTCSIMIISPDKNITMMNRHKDFHKTWEPKSEILDPFKQLPAQWYVFCGEVLHLKTPGIKDTFYLYDLLVAGDVLYGQTYKDRYNMMYKMFEKQITNIANPGFFNINNKLWLCKNIEIGFENFYNSLTEVEDEGLVLRDPSAKLNPCFKADSNDDWLVKCRKAHPNYGF